MNTLEILLQQIGLFVIYILAGMILVKTKVLNSETLDPISRFVIKMGTAGDDFCQYHRRCGAGYTFSFLIYSGDRSSVLYLHVHHKSGNDKNISPGRRPGGNLPGDVLFGNVGFMGIPIITSIFHRMEFFMFQYLP